MSSTDGITRNTTPTFKVTAPANSIVTLYANGVLVGQATANNGPVFITTTSLVAGTYQMTATAEDVAGNVSAVAGPVKLVVSTTPPTTPTLGLDAASQSPTGQTTETNLQSVTLTGTTTRASSSPCTGCQTRILRLRPCRPDRPGLSRSTRCAGGRLAGIYRGRERRCWQQQRNHADDHDDGK